MKLRFVLACSVALAACSGSDGKIEVEAASEALSAQGGDRLFTIKLLEARDEGYALEGLRVRVEPDGKDAIDVVCAPSDANGNGKLDQGDTMSCSEPAENAFGPDLAGTEADVELFAVVEGEEERVGDAVWTMK